MELEIFLDYYKPLDSEMKVDKLFELCFKSMHQAICATDLSKIMDVTNEDIKPYLFEKKAELDNYIVQLKKVRKKREKLKKKASKRSRHSPSVYNKDEIVYKRIHIISTAM